MAATPRIPSPRTALDTALGGAVGTAQRPRRRSRAPIVETPLGSLTQRDRRVVATCRGCGSAHVTRLSMSLTDGTPVEFTSCHRCEHRTWEHGGGELSVDTVIARSRKA